MATAVKNIAGLNIAPLSAFNAPLVNSNVQTINVLGTTGISIETYTIEFDVPFVLTVPTTGSSSPWKGKNVILQILDPIDSASDTLVRFEYSATSSFPSVSYDVSLCAGRLNPLLTGIPIHHTVHTVTVTLATGTTAVIRTIVYGD